MSAFGRLMRGRSNANIDEIAQANSIANSIEEPLIMVVDAGECEERV